jgi:hypothetical protein
MRKEHSLITGAAAVFILFSIIGLFFIHLYSMDSINPENALYIEKDKLKDDMVYAVIQRFYIGDGPA